VVVGLWKAWKAVGPTLPLWACAVVLLWKFEVAVVANATRAREADHQLLMLACLSKVAGGGWAGVDCTDEFMGVHSQVGELLKPFCGNSSQAGQLLLCCGRAAAVVLWRAWKAVLTIVKLMLLSVPRVHGRALAGRAAGCRWQLNI
jgi:hypothetical protein